MDGRGEAIAARNPNLHVVRIPDAGHLPWLDAPERVVAEIERFLAPSSGGAVSRARTATEKEAVR